jgi:hypothetical protein
MRVGGKGTFRLWSLGRRCDYVGVSVGVPRIAADLLRRRSRQVGPKADD